MRYFLRDRTCSIARAHTHTHIYFFKVSVWCLISRCRKNALVRSRAYISVYERMATAPVSLLGAGGGALPLKPLSRMEQLIREIFDCLNRGIWSSYRTNYKIYCMRISGTSTTLYVLIGLRLLDLFFCTSYANMMFASSQHVTPFVYLSCC